MIRLEDLRSLPGQAAAAARSLAVASSGRAHPRLDGRVAARGLREPVRIVRDRFGVPHVYAATEAGAIYGQGFVHAQDRLFQIDVQRRVAAGRLAETVGERGVETDRLMRRLGFADRAGRDLASLDPDDRELLIAYTAGVNAGIRSLRALPPEYTLLQTRPEPWHPEHSLLLGRLLMFSFAPNWDTELQRLQLIEAIGPARAALVDVRLPRGRAHRDRRTRPRRRQAAARGVRARDRGGRSGRRGIERLGAHGRAHRLGRAAARL